MKFIKAENKVQSEQLMVQSNEIIQLVKHEKYLKEKVKEKNRNLEKREGELKEEQEKQQAQCIMDLPDDKYRREFPQKTKICNLRRKKIFREKLFLPFLRTHCPLSYCQKLEKTNEAILHKVQKTLFLGIFWPKFAQKIFFPKIGLRHILGIAILHLCAKNQQKLMSQSREKLVTDERTDERTDNG